MVYERSCGAVIFTRKENKVQYVIIRSLGGDYGFPKGHMETGETERQTALREIREEVGLRPRILDGFRTVTEYPLPGKPGVSKRVTYFLAYCEDPQLRFQPEELSGAWLMEYDEAMGKLRFQESRRILRDAKVFLEEEYAQTC